MVPQQIALFESLVIFFLSTPDFDHGAFLSVTLTRDGEIGCISRQFFQCPRVLLRNSTYWSSICVSSINFKRKITGTAYPGADTARSFYCKNFVFSGVEYFVMWNPKRLTVKIAILDKVIYLI